jgi:hypothetical protein
VAKEHQFLLMLKGLKLSSELGATKSSWAISHISLDYRLNISGTDAIITLDCAPD